MVLDFGTEALKVLSEERRFLKYFDDYDYTGNFSRTIDFVFGGFEKKPEQVLLSLPPNVLKARIVLQVFKRRASQKVISGKEEKEINETILQRAKKEVSISFSQLSGIFPEHLRFVSLRILERGIKIDGYEVPRLEGYDGKILEFKILAVFLPGFTEIERILRQKTGDFKIVHAAEGLIRILKDYPDGVFLDVGGEITQIFLAREGKLEAVCELGFGGKIFSETISERLGLREKDARLFKERYSKKGLTPESSSKIKEIFHFPSRLWFDNLKEKLKETQGGLLFPSNVFLFGGSCQLSEIKEILEMGKWGNIAFFDAKPKVKILDDPQFLIALLLNPMVKKVIDILPPKKSKEVFQEKIISKSPRQRPSLNIWKKSLAVFFALIIFVFVSLHFFFAKAEIEIAPKTQPFNFSETVTADVNTQSLNLEQSLIPGIIFEVEKEAAEEFQATATILKKAEGKIRLYNNFTTQTETWLKGTRFVSSEGKLFLSKDAIRVPGATLKNGRIEASFVDVPVIAAEGGQEYNIGPSNFSIAAFLGTARYTQYHGESSEPMAGGGVFPKVSKEDLDRAEAALTQEAKNESEAELAGKIPDDFVFLKEAVRSETLEKSSQAELNQETDKFEFRVRTKSSILSFRFEDLRGIADNFVVSQLELGKTFYKEGLKTEYQFQAFNSQEHRLLVLLRGSAKIYSEVDLNLLKRSLAGKSFEESKLLLSNQEELSRAQIRLFPFWRNSLPSKLEKIEINLVVD